MPTFEYIAIDHTGKQRRGSVVGETAGAARHQLRQQKLHATELHPISETAAKNKFELASVFGARRRRDILDFTRQLSTMIDANVQLTEALSVLASQVSDPKLTQVIQNIRDQVLAGESFTDCLKQYPNWFDKIYLSMVRVGEVTGNLGKTLLLLSDYMGKRQRIETKIKSALVYPAILVVISLLVTIVLMTFVVPKLTRIIISSGKTPPAVTQFLMDTSDFLIHYWWFLLIGMGAGFWAFRRWVASSKGRLVFDRFKLKIPIVGELVRQSVVARFTSTLAALIRSGLPMAESLLVVSEVTGNAVMTQAVVSARERIMAGADISTPLRESKVIDIAVAHMISVGERTGEMEKMLLSISENIEETTDVRVQRISSVIEPLVIVVMACVIGFIVMATMLPIFQVSNLANN